MDNNNFFIASIMISLHSFLLSKGSSIFLVILSGLPILMANISSLPSSVTIGGTGILIVVGVAIETYKQIESGLISRSYKKRRRIR